MWKKIRLCVGIWQYYIAYRNWTRQKYKFDVPQSVEGEKRWKSTRDDLDVKKKLDKL